ncbi:MAG: hypothetical protein WCS74_04730 [Dehalococcoidales bacterium]|nr:hypothetical protein [Dehalococcoidales bacterium]
MKRTLKMLAVGFGVVALAALAVGTTVFADSPRGNGDPLTCDDCGGAGLHGVGITSSESVADLLGITTDELCGLRADGISLADIAVENGISLEALVEAVIADRAEAVQAMVDDGLITQQQADLMLERMTERVEVALTRTTTGPAEWGMGNKYNGTNAGDGTGTGYRWGNQINNGIGCGEPGSGEGDSQSMHQHGKNR